MILYFLRANFARFFIQLFVVFSITQAASAATLSSVDVDRSSTVITGTGFLSATSGGISVSAFGPSASLTSTNAPLFPSVTIGSTGQGSVSFTGLGFPPLVALGGAIEDVLASASMLEILFQDGASGNLFVLDLSSSIVSGNGLVLNAPSIDATASVTVFSAALVPVPVPASGWLFAPLLLIVGRNFRRVRPA